MRAALALAAALGLGLGCIDDATDCDRACLAAEDACFLAIVDGGAGCDDLTLCETIALACFERCG